jgi:hypothetical protein
MMHQDTECALCERIVPADEVDSQRCYDCGAIICSEHSGEPEGVHEPEDHISADDAEDDEDDER